LRRREAINIEIPRVANFCPTHARLPEPNGRNESVLSHSVKRLILLELSYAANVSAVKERKQSKKGIRKISSFHKINAMKHI
jgi:hypothetical protein